MATGYCHAYHSNCTERYCGIQEDQLESFFLDLQLMPNIFEKMQRLTIFQYFESKRRFKPHSLILKIIAYMELL